MACSMLNLARACQTVNVTIAPNAKRMIHKLEPAPRIRKPEHIANPPIKPILSDAVMR